MKRITLRMPVTLWEKIKSIIEYKGYTMNQFAIDVLWKYVEDWEKNNER